MSTRAEVKRMHGTGKKYWQKLGADLKRDKWLYLLLLPGVIYFIAFKYLPPQVDNDNVLDVVYDILRLSEDLKKHTFIEEKIMVPLVKHLENAILK